MGRKKVLEDELNDLEGKLQRAEKLVTGVCLSPQAWQRACPGCCRCCLHAQPLRILPLAQHFADSHTTLWWLHVPHGCWHTAFCIRKNH